MAVTVVKGSTVTGTLGTYTPAWPASTGGVWGANDWGVVVVVSKPGTASTIASFGTGGGTRSFASTNGTAQGSNAGDTIVTVRWAQLAGTEGGTTVSVTDSDDSVTIAQCYVLHSDVGWSTDVAQAWGTDDVTGSSYSAACGGDSGASYQTGDVLIAATSIASSQFGGTVWSAEAFAASGLTFDTVTEQQEFASGSGNNIGGVVTTARVASGSASGGPTVTFSATNGASSGNYGPTVILGFREGTPNVSITATPATATAAAAQATVTAATSSVTTNAIAAAAVAAAALASVTTTTSAIIDARPAVAVASAPQATVATTAQLDVAARPAAGVTGGGFADVATSSAQDLQVYANPAWVTSAPTRATVTTTAQLDIAGLPAVAIAAAPSAAIATVTDITVSANPAWAVAVTASADVFVGVPPVETDTSNDDDGIYLGDGYAEVVWEPAVVAVPATLAPGEYRTVATVIDTAPAAHAPAAARTLSIPAAIDRVQIDNVDLTFYGGAAAVVENIKLIDPLLYGNATITLPAINPQFPSDLGDLHDYFRFARVRIQRVLDGAVVATDHKGFVSRVDTSGTELRLEVGGQAAGALSQLYVPPPVYRRKQDVEHILVDTLRDARVQAKEHDGASGLGLIRRGGSDGLSIFNETLAVWAGSTGQAITFTPNAHGVYRKTQKPGVEDPADFTCYPSDLVQIDLSQDFMEQYTRVYAQGYTAAGQLVANIKTPGLTQGDAPELDATLLPGDESDQVALLQEQLAIHDYLDLDDVTSGVFDDETEAAVLAFKYDSEDLVSLTPEVGVPAWEALWNLSEIGYSLDDAREYPTASDPTVAKWLRTANGSKLRENPNYDPHLIPNDVFIDVGGPFGKGVIRDYARSKLVPEGGVWSGTITLRSGVVAGVHNPGDPFTTADIMDRRDVLPNMKAWLPYFGGGVTVYVSGVDHSADTTSLLVSSVPQTTMEVWRALERRKEARSNPGRAWSGHTRRSQVRNDNGPQWDTSSGLIANNVDLASGWNEVKVPAGQAGIVQRVKVQLGTPAEFAMLLTQKPVSVDALNNNSATATPLVDPRPSARPWFERETVVSWLEDRAYLDAWGTPKQPCGYDPSLKADEQGPTAQPITGLFKESAGLNYETGSEPVLYLYIWVGSTNTLQRGRILRNQRTTDI